MSSTQKTEGISNRVSILVDKSLTLLPLKNLSEICIEA